MKLKKNSIIVASHVKKRVRFIYKKLNSTINQRALEATIITQPNVSEVRVNSNAQSIIVRYTGESYDDIVKFIKNLDLTKFKATTVHTDKSAIYASAGALAISFVSPNSKITLATSAITSFPLIVSGLKEFVKEGLTSKFLESLAVGVSLFRGDYSAANGTNLLLNIGEYMEESTVARSDELVRELASPDVEDAWIEIKKDGKFELKKVKSDSIKVGDIVVVSDGEHIVVDGYIIDGIASVNQVSMTGEAAAVKKERGDKVLSGTIVESGKIRIWAESVGTETITARIKEYIQLSLNEKSNIGLKATKLADKLVPLTLGLAGASYFINRQWDSVASVLQGDYSCALKLSTPVTFKKSISQLGKNGILCKGARAIEKLSEVDTFVFDKTGTLTSGDLEVVHIRSFIDDISNEELLNMTASAEEHYFHPVAEAIVKAANERGFKHIHHGEVEFIVAHGVKTRVNNKEVLVGSRHFLEDDEHVDFTGYEEELDKYYKDGLTILYISYNKKLAGIIGMRDEVRENAKDTIAQLKQNGIKRIVMLTGDVDEKAKDISSELGIDEVYSNCLPTDKTNIIKKLKKEGRKVAFVGDGINDAPSLATADVGISMQKGADIAKASADISLLKDDISCILYAKEISNKTVKKVHTNFNIAVVTNTLILGAASFGKLSPIATAVLHNGTTVGLLLNSMKKI